MERTWQRDGAHLDDFALEGFDVEESLGLGACEFTLLLLYLLEFAVELEGGGGGGFCHHGKRRSGLAVVDKIGLWE